MAAPGPGGEDAARDTDTLFAAIAAGDVALVREMLRQDKALANISQSQRPPLCHAASLAKLDCLTALVEAGACLDFPDDEGNCALHHAAKAGAVACAALLVEKGALLSVANHAGAGPADMAEQEGHAALVALLDGALADESEEQFE